MSRLYRITTQRAEVGRRAGSRSAETMVPRRKTPAARSLQSPAAMRLLVGVLGVWVVLCGHASYGRGDEVAAPSAPTVNAPAAPAAAEWPDPFAAPSRAAAPDGSPAATVVPPVVVAPPIVVPPPLVAPPPIVAPALLLAPADSEAVANAKALRLGGILLFAVGVPLTIASQVLVALAITTGLNFFEDNEASQAEIDRQQRPYRIAAIVTTISGNIMIASGLAMWGTGNAQLRNNKPRALTVGSLYAAPSTEGHGGVGGLVVHF
jgi:hypothetical protein